MSRLVKRIKSKGTWMSLGRAASNYLVRCIPSPGGKEERRLIIPWQIRTASREGEDFSQNTFLIPSGVIIYIICYVFRAKMFQWIFWVQNQLLIIMLYWLSIYCNKSGLHQFTHQLYPQNFGWKFRVYIKSFQREILLHLDTSTRP